MKKVCSLAIALALTFTLVACGGTPAPAGSPAASNPPASSQPSAPEAVSDLAYVQDKGVLVVGITDFAPMDYKDESGEWIGFDADMARKVALDLGVDVEFVEIDWGGKIMELDSKAIDCVWNGMTLTDEVKGAMSTSNPYAQNGQVVVMPTAKAADYTTLESLAGLSFAVEAGSAGEKAAQENGFDTVVLQTQAMSLVEVAAGASDACVIDLLMTRAMTGAGTSYEQLGEVMVLNSEEYGIGFRKGSDLCEKVNELVAGYYADGSMLDIAEQYGIAPTIIPQG